MSQPAKTQAALTVEGAIGLYRAYQTAEGHTEGSRRVSAYALRALFRPVLGEPLRSLTPERIRTLLAAKEAETSPQTRRPLKERTKAGYASYGRAFTRWATAAGHLEADPMAPCDPQALAQLQHELRQVRAELANVMRERDNARAELRALGGELHLSPVDAKRLGSMVRQLRQAASLTRRKLEAQTGIPVAMITKIETGRRRPSAWALRRLCGYAPLRQLPAMAAAAGIQLNLGHGPKDKE